MSSFSAGDRVTTVKDIGGVVREAVPKGTSGVVTHAGFLGGDLRVRFTIRGLFGDRQVEMSVDKHEIA